MTNLQEWGLGTDPQVADTDGDGLDDRTETEVHGTDPLQADTDSDGLPDGWEVAHAFDPRSNGGLAYDLVARWRFDESAGELATNSVSADWPGTLQAMEASNRIAGRNRRALWFDGTNDFVSVAQSNALAVVTGAPFTVTAVIWQEPGATSGVPTVVSDGLLVDTNWPGFALRYQDWHNALVGIAGSSNRAYVLVAQTNWLPAMAGRWVDVALAHDGTTARLYVDGRQVSAIAGAFSARRMPELRIGGGHVNVPTAYWLGGIDDVRVYRRALDSAALAAVNDWVGDADGDGTSNGAEYLLGTDPRHP